MFVDPLHKTYSIPFLSAIPTGKYLTRESKRTKCRFLQKRRCHLLEWLCFLVKPSEEKITWFKLHVRVEAMYEMIFLLLFWTCQAEKWSFSASPSVACNLYSSSPSEINWQTTCRFSSIKCRKCAKNLARTWSLIHVIFLLGFVWFAGF
jgi:hypothetical protein